MFCNKCGNRNPLNSHFCRHCGARLDVVGAATHLSEDMYKVGISGEPQPVFDEAKVQRLLDRAFELSEKGDIVGAIIACREALVENPSSVSAHSFLGLLYERQGEKENAIAQYRIVLDLNPDSTVDRENLERLLNEMRHQRSRLGGEGTATPFLNAWRTGKWMESPYIRSVPVVAAVMASVLFVLLINIAVSPRSTQQGMDDTKREVAAYIREGREAFSRGELNEAEANFKLALRRDPENTDVLHWLERIDERRTAQQPFETPQSSSTPSPPPSPTPPVAAQPPTETPGRPARGTTPVPQREPAAAEQPDVIPPPPPRTSARSSLPPPPQWVITQRRPRERPPAPGPSTSNPPVPPPTSGGTRTPPSEQPLVYRPPEQPLENPVTIPPPAPIPAPVPSGGAASSSPVKEEPGGFEYQQKGLQLQRQRRYAEAKVAFQKAVLAYRQQKESGVRVREADEGIRTCETAARLCDMYLHGSPSALR